MGEDGRFLEELRKRGVVRTGLLYAAGAFALLEFADIAFPRLGLPDGAVNVVLWVGLAGFPLAVFVSWGIDIRAQRDGGRSRRWLSPTTVAASAVLIALGVGMGALWGSQEHPGRSSTGPSAPIGSARGPALAVLAFSDLSASADYGYFAAGLSEEISTALSRFPGIRVISPNATSYFDGVAEDLSRLDQLGVRYLLQGSVRRDSRQARISAHLLDAATGSQLWGESYSAELEPSELLSVQERIAERIASTIGDTTGVLVQLGQEDTRRKGTSSLEAYDCVLLAQSYFKLHTQDLSARVRECLEHAVEVDPEYAEAWAHLAFHYREEYFHGWSRGTDPSGRASRAVQRAIALDGASAMAHYARSLILFDQHDVERAAAAAERVLAINPHDSALLAGLSVYLAKAGRLDRALELTREVERLNPLHNRWIHGVRALAHYERGEFEQARSEASRGNPGGTSSIILAASYGQLGRKAEARETWQELIDSRPDFAGDPLGLLHRELFREESVARFAEGLRLAGIELE